MADAGRTEGTILIDWHWVALALIQGLTEFLPVSSSAHLILPSQLLGWPDQGLAFDVAVHVGTLAAVVLFYRSVLAELARGAVDACLTRRKNPASEQIAFLAIATVPAVVAGFLGNHWIESHLRGAEVIAATTLIFGVLLAIADRRVAQTERWRLGFYLMALALGVAQAMALVPGVSRSGVTITAALLLGFSYQNAAQTSFLMSIPVIAGAGLLKAVDLLETGDALLWGGLALAALVAGVAAYTCIALFLRVLDRIGLMPFVWYRLALGSVLGVMAW